MALREVLIAFKVIVDQADLQDTQKNVDGLIDSFKKLAGAATFALAAAAAKKGFEFISDVIEAANHVKILSERYATTTKETQELMAVSDASGVHFTQLLHGFRAINTAAEKGAEEFHELGINVRQGNGQFKTQVDLFWEVGESLSKVTDTTHRTYLAQRLLGRAGQQLMPIFAGSKEEIEKFRAKIAETSEVFSEAFITKARLSALNMQVLSRTWQKAAGLLTEQLLPAFNWLVEQLTEGGKWLQGWIKDGSAMNATISALIIGVGALVVALAPLALEAAAAVAPFVAMFLLLDDLVTFLNGGDSVIGDLFTVIFGEGGADKARQWIQDVWAKISEFWTWLSNPDRWATTWFNFYTNMVTWVGKAVDWIETKIGELATSINQKLRGALGDTAANLMGIPKQQQKGPDGKPVAAPESGPGFFSKLLGGVDTNDPLIQGLNRAAARQGQQTPDLPPAGIGSHRDASGTLVLDTPPPAPIINNNITVGTATPEATREMATAVTTATSQSLGRDRAAVAIGFGVK
jgi:hypothetical protein